VKNRTVYQQFHLLGFNQAPKTILFSKCGSRVEVCAVPSSVLSTVTPLLTYVEYTPGLILVSCRGMSKYNVYKRSLPHELVKQFAISPTKDGKTDSVAKNDGQGNVLEPDFPRG